MHALMVIFRSSWLSTFYEMSIYSDTCPGQYHTLVPPSRSPFRWVELMQILVLRMRVEVICQLRIIVCGRLRSDLIEHFIVLLHPE